MNNVKQAVAAAILAGSMALTFGGAASADGPCSLHCGGNSPTVGGVGFVVAGTPATAPFNPYEIPVFTQHKVPPQATEKVEIAVEKIDRVMR